MKAIFFLIVALVAGKYLWQEYRTPPEDFSNPVYAEIHMTMDIQSRSLEGVVYGKTLNQGDCKTHIEAFEKSLNPKTCPMCKVTVSECKTELAPRYARFFDNTPGNLTYVSLARGEPSEREMRMIFWGVSVDESDTFCNLVPELQRERKGAVTCVRAARG